jgi:hypothetical protein
MPQSLVEIAKDLTVALVKTGTIPAEDLQETLQKTHATLSALRAQEAMGTTTTGPVAGSPPGDWRKSITRHAVICLECGRSGGQQGKRAYFYMWVSESLGQKKKVWNYKFPNVSTVMWPSPAVYMENVKQDEIGIAGMINAITSSS